MHTDTKHENERCNTAECCRNVPWNFFRDNECKHNQENNDGRDLCCHKKTSSNIKSPCIYYVVKRLTSQICIGKFYGFFEGLLGEEGKCYIPYLMSVGLFIGIANVIGLFGFKPPTKDLNCTIALALMSIILVEAAGIRAKGVKKWAKGFTQPVAIITPINILEIFIRPFSLCLRLFGNVLGAFVIMELIKAVVPMVVPLVFSFYFDIFDGLIQAYVFVFLTSLYIKEAIELQAE